jgi:TonB family protein
MNRLQKKCVIATTGVHLLLIVILFVGPAFFYSRPKADDLQVLEVIPANLIDASFNSGVANAAPPPPAPPAPTPPAPVVPQLPPPVPQKTEPPKPVEKVERASEPTEKLSASDLRKIQISTQLVSRPTPKGATGSSSDVARARAIRNALRSLKSNLTSATTVDMPGNSSVAYANYASAVKSVYDQAWELPDTIANEEENVIVRVTIANDGTVLSANIVTPSGDTKVDASVQRTLERVKFIAPFPEGATEKERTYTINFNPKAKRMIE